MDYKNKINQIIELLEKDPQEINLKKTLDEIIGLRIALLKDETIFGDTYRIGEYLTKLDQLDKLYDNRKDELRLKEMQKLDEKFKKFEENLHKNS